MATKSSLTLPPGTALRARPRGIIVGASSGIGEALARRLAREGYVLALLGRRSAALQTLCARINQDAGETRAVPYPHDTTDTASIPALFQTIFQDLKGLDLLVYTAGVMPAVAFSEYNFEKDRQMVEVNLLGGMAWLGQAATVFERRRGGSLVGISSVAGDRGRVKNPGYNASKAGLTAYLEGLRNRLTRRGVHVLTVKPGPVDTALTKEVGGLFMISPDQAASDIAKAIRKRRQTLYTPARWALIMLLVRHIPSIVFRRLNF